MTPNTGFRLSRIESEGWKEAQSLMTRDVLTIDEDRIATLNPHSADPQRARWHLGFANALRAGGCR
jgi:hypothetical protein